MEVKTVNGTLCCGCLVAQASAGLHYTRALRSILGVPVSVVTGAAAVLLMVVAGRWWQGGRDAQVSVRKALQGAPWQIVLFSLGMYLVVYGLGKAGLTGLGADALQWLAGQGDFVATVGSGVLAALVASVMNNLPSTLVSALAIEQAQVTEKLAS